MPSSRAEHPHAVLHAAGGADPRQALCRRAGDRPRRPCAATDGLRRPCDGARPRRPAGRWHRAGHRQQPCAAGARAGRAAARAHLAMRWSSSNPQATCRCSRSARSTSRCGTWSRRQLRTCRCTSCWAAARPDPGLRQLGGARRQLTDYVRRGRAVAWRAVTAPTSCTPSTIRRATSASCQRRTRGGRSRRRAHARRRQDVRPQRRVACRPAARRTWISPGSRSRCRTYDMQGYAELRRATGHPGDRRRDRSPGHVYSRRPTTCAPNALDMVLCDVYWKAGITGMHKTGGVVRGHWASRSLRTTAPSPLMNFANLHVLCGATNADWIEILVPEAGLRLRLQFVTWRPTADG